MRPTILFVQPSIQPPGGGRAVAVWILQALRDEYEIILASEDEPDLRSVNDYFGTSLERGDFATPTAGARLHDAARRVLDRFPGRLTRVRRALYVRWCRRLARRVDLVVSSWDEIDVGRRAIQYVHFPFHRALIDVDARRAAGRWASAWRIYDRATRMVSGESIVGIRRNVTLVNSKWTARVFEETVGAPTRMDVVYPPIHGPFPSIPWERRRNGFVALGRIHEAKRILEMIDIVDRVRARGHTVTFDIVGSVENAKYYEQIRQLASDRPWITISLDMPRAALNEFLASFRYGLHGMPDEHFGMAIAEMVMAGCVVFVPRSGGQVEIVGDDGRLLYDGPEEASRKIAEVLDDEPTQRALRNELRARVERFSPSDFAARIRTIVRDEIEAGHRRPGL